tara:strand:- start:177 stop:575 length:399 start_codon:yes stop_codon:yes gene_type:complete
VSRNDYTKEDALRDRKYSLLCTLEMMTGMMKPDHYSGDAIDIKDWMNNWSIKELNSINFRTLLTHTNYIFHWIGDELDLPSEEIFDRYVAFVHGPLMAFMEHEVENMSDEVFDDAVTILDMEDMLKEDDDER